MHGSIIAATLRRIVDGDTQILLYWLGAGITREARCRLRGLNAAEVHRVQVGSAEHRAGVEQMEWVRRWYHEAAMQTQQEYPLLVGVFGTDKYGRDLVVVKRKFDGEILNDAFIATWPHTAASTTSS